MTEEYLFGMKVTGEESAVARFAELLTEQEKTDGKIKVELHSVERIKTSKTGEQIVNAMFDGSCVGSFSNAIRDTKLPDIVELTKNLGIAFEAYAHNEPEDTTREVKQEHIIIDRGQFVTDNKAEMTKYDVNKLTENELEELLFVEGIEDKETLLEFSDKNGMYCVGGFEYFEQYQSLFPFLGTDPRQYYKYDSSYGDTYFITFGMDIYADFNNLYLGMGYYDEELQCLAPFGDVTVNIQPLPFLESAVDINNNGPAILPFLENNGIAHDTGKILRSGYVVYPVFKFEPDKLSEIAPKEFEEYCKAHGRKMAETLKKPLDQQIQEAEKKAEETGQRKTELKPER